MKFLEIISFFEHSKTHFLNDAVAPLSKLSMAAAKVICCKLQESAWQV
jgi:hypothetical protein